MHSQLLARFGYDATVVPYLEIRAFEWYGSAGLVIRFITQDGDIEDSVVGRTYSLNAS